MNLLEKNNIKLISCRLIILGAFVFEIQLHFTLNTFLYKPNETRDILHNFIQHTSDS